MSKPKVTAYLDADVIMFRAVSFCLDEWEGTPAADVRQALKFFDLFLDKWLREVSQAVDIEEYHLVFTKFSRFRKEIFPEYKANRKDIKHWPGMWRLKDQLLDLHNSVFEDNLEADDVIGLLVTADRETRIAVSADKDFKTLPIRFYVPSSHGKTHGEWFDMSEDEANLNWLRQVIMGDTIDNFKGIPRVGVVKAEKYLPECEPVGELWSKTKAAYIKHGLTEDDALVMARLARILRDGEYNWETKEIKLWKP